MKQTTIVVTEDESYRLLRAFSWHLRKADAKTMGDVDARLQLDLWLKLQRAHVRVSGHDEVFDAVPPFARQLIYDALLPKPTTKKQKAERATRKQAATRRKRQPAPTVDPVSEAVAGEIEARARVRRGRERAARTLEPQAPADPIPSAS